MRRECEEEKARLLYEIESLKTVNAQNARDGKQTLERKDSEIMKSRERLGQLEREVVSLREGNKVLRG